MLAGPTAAAGLRLLGLALLALAAGASSLTFNWILEHRPEANWFPEFAGRVIYLSDIFLVAGLACWAAGWWRTPGRSMQYGPRYVFLPLACLTALTVLSVVWAQDSALAGYSALRRVMLLGLYLALASEARRATVLATLALFIVGFLHAAAALVQVAKGSSAGLSLLGELPGIAAGQAYGLGFNPNPVGLCLAVTVVLAWGLFLLREGGWKVRSLLMACFLLFFSGLIATSSRSALLGCFFGALLVSLLAWLGSNPEGRRLLRNRALAGAWVLFLAGGLYAGAILAAGDRAEDSGSGPSRGVARVLERFSFSQITSGLEGRAWDLGLAVPIIQEHPLLGVGAANYPLALKEILRPNDIGGVYTPPHNVLVLLLAELGVLGALAWAGIMAAPLIWFLFHWRPKKPGARDQGSLIWLGPLIVLLFAGLWDFPSWATQDGRVIMMAVLGLWAGRAGAGQPSPAGKA